MKKLFAFQGKAILILPLFILGLFIFSSVIRIPFAEATTTTMIQTGTYVGNGLDDRNITGVGFQPDLVIIKGHNYHYGAIRSSTMPAGFSKTTDGSYALESNHIQSLDADGFQIGSSTYINESGKKFFWVAMKGSPDMALGSYTGNGINRSIAGLSFQPEYMMILPSHAKPALQRSVTMTPTFWLGADTGYTDRITSLNTNGFSLGKSKNVNESGYTYHYIAWNEVAGS
ncbi:MAG: hypothetical protein V1908_04460, partial [Candidatus Peregrinibacteria bacterium]